MNWKVFALLESSFCVLLSVVAVIFLLFVMTANGGTGIAEPIAVGDVVLAVALTLVAHGQLIGSFRRPANARTADAGTRGTRVTDAGKPGDESAPGAEEAAGPVLLGPATVLLSPSTVSVSPAKDLAASGPDSQNPAVQRLGELAKQNGHTPLTPAPGVATPRPGSWAIPILTVLVFVGAAVLLPLAGSATWAGFARVYLTYAMAPPAALALVARGMVVLSTRR